MIKGKKTLVLAGALVLATLSASLNYKEAEWRYKAGGTPHVPVDKVARTLGLGDQELGFKYHLCATKNGVFSIQADAVSICYLVLV